MKGLTDMVVIILSLVVTILIGVVLYMVFANQTSIRRGPSDAQQELQTTPTPTISDSDDLETIETELDSTTTGSFDEDIQEMDEDASSL